MQTQINRFRMNYDDTGGAGVPLLLVHGFPLDRTVWANQTAELAGVARVIAPDLRGFGQSTMPDGMTTLESYADDLNALLDVLKIPSAVIAGLSMGGYIALAFYRQYTGRVRGLILADTKAGADSPEAKKGRDDNASAARAYGAEEIAKRMLPKMLTPKTIENNFEMAQTVREMMARQSVEAIVAALMAMRDRADSTSLLTQIKTPTLIITGADDLLIPPKEAEAMHQAIAGSSLVTIPNAAHLSNVEQPEAFNQAVLEFLHNI
jgi:pimeloyl-ACP methyl ester carboxylesterase